MKIASGVDLVYIPRFKKALKSGGENFLRRVFHETELRRHLPCEQRRHLEIDAQHLAGIFAAKESIIKALGLSTDIWNEIRITDYKNSAPTVQIDSALQSYKLQIENCSLSISHDKNYVVAQFVAIIR